MDFIIQNEVLIKYQGNASDVLIPEGVSKIGSGAFENCETIKRHQLGDEEYDTLDPDIYKHLRVILN